MENRKKKILLPAWTIWLSKFQIFIKMPEADEGRVPSLVRCSKRDIKVQALAYFAVFLQIKIRRVHNIDLPNYVSAFEMQVERTFSKRFVICYRLELEVK